MMAFNLLYIDPGTGSMLFSVLISLFALGYFAFRGVLIKLRLLFAGKKGERGKRIPYVIYNEGRQYWNTFKPVVEEFEKRGIPLVYYTSAKDDPVFDRSWQYVKSEFIGEGNKAYARLNLMEADVCLMTTPGLDVFQLKRSKRLAKTHYYPTFRSEYGVATEILQELKPQTLLEIGCGNGAFLDRIQHMIPMVMGSEYNTAAAEECQQRGLNVRTEDISTINIPIDVVCHFEVLEHVFDTKKLMHDTLWLLNPGGKLIIGTPDPDGILSVNGTGILHLPPHHQFDFSKQTFEWLAEKYNLNLVDYRKTELTYHHYANYVKNLTGMPLTQPDMIGFYETQKKYTNHSHVVVFEKKIRA